VKLVWYDGRNKPSADLVGGAQISSGGVIVIGDKDTLYQASEHGQNCRLLKGTPPEVTFEKSPGHFEELIRAMDGGKRAMSDIVDYSGPLTETVVLGNLAVWNPGPTLEWDAATMKVKGRPDLDALIKPEYREGWRL